MMLSQKKLGLRVGSFPSWGPIHPGRPESYEHVGNVKTWYTPNAILPKVGGPVV